MIQNWKLCSAQKNIRKSSSNFSVQSKAKNFLIILISPSGGGKSSILQKVLNTTENIVYSVSYTTRKPRHDEVDSLSYHFLSEDDFFFKKKNNEFLETAKVHGNWYGTSINFIRQSIAEGKHIIMDIDYVGALQILKKKISAITIFILPPSREVWLERLKKRGTEDDETLQKRLQTAETELQQLQNFQYLVINKELDDAAEKVKAIIHAEEMKMMRNTDIIRRFNEK